MLNILRLVVLDKVIRKVNLVVKSMISRYMMKMVFVPGLRNRRIPIDIV